MIDPDPAFALVADALALLLLWLVGAVSVRRLLKMSWSTSIVRGFGLALISLVLFMALRIVAPDFIVVPLMFVLLVIAEALIEVRSGRPERVLAVPVLISMLLVGTLVLVDGALRLTGYRLTFTA